MPRSPLREGQQSGVSDASEGGVGTTGSSPSKTSRMKHITPDEVLQGFFYDDAIVRNLNRHGLDVAKGHLQLLLASDV